MSDKTTRPRVTRVDEWLYSEREVMRFFAWGLIVGAGLGCVWGVYFGIYLERIAGHAH